jgi:hypothetical protein
VTEKKASEKLAELRERSPVLADLHLSSPANRSALEKERELEEQIATKHQNDVVRLELARLEKVAPLTARLRRLELSSGAIAAGIFKEANGIELRMEAERLKSGQPEPDPPAAA